MAPTAAIKGLALAASFHTAGSLATVSLISIPSILAVADDDSVTARTLAQQFTLGHRMGKLLQAPAECLGVAAFGFLAWDARTHGGWATPATTWKLYAAAAAAMFAVVPWTVAVMEKDSQKIVSVAVEPGMPAAEKEPALEHEGKPAGGSGGGMQLEVPGGAGAARESITPVEEFEPYDDAPFSGEEYEKLKVKKMLQQWSTRNVFRICSVTVAGVCGLWATLQ